MEWQETYLIPQKLAIRATPGNIKVWEQKSKIIQKDEKKDFVQKPKDFASKLEWG